jgi:hypothetical protein
LLEPLPTGRRSGPLEPFEKIALGGFGCAALIQAGLGAYRAYAQQRPYGGPLLVALGLLLCGGLWLLRARRMRGAVVAMPAGLLLATAGFYSGYTAINVPFVSVLGRFAVPVLLFLLGAVLLFAEQDWSFQAVPFSLAAIAFLVVQVVLTLEVRSDGRPVSVQQGSTFRDGGVIGEVQLIPLARSFVDAINARDAATIRTLSTIAPEQLPVHTIAVTRWIAEDNTVIAFGTASGKPAAMRAEFRNGKIIEWQVYIDPADDRGGRK